MGATHILQILAGSLAFTLFWPDPILASPRFPDTLVLGTLAAGLAFFGVEVLIGPILMRLKYGFSLREVMKEAVVPALPSDALAVATALATALAATAYGPLAAVSSSPAPPYRWSRST